MKERSQRPGSEEFAPYYDRYISRVPEGDVVMTLRNELEETLKLCRGLSEVQSNLRYAEGKWSIKEVIGHINDAERIFACRALRFARNDSTPLPGFEQDDYMPNASFSNYPFQEIVDEFQHIRLSTLSLFSHLSPEAWDRRGVASEAPVSVRAL